ncbi:hypothetical protein FB567DRAFT_561890 [Paraphoma chrysanthemicola]|uniref:Uncharacterized protein n=1 Tax=Paraphoma chrysanthemicola TaxID=798071 RepID=A0A8K0R4Z2_9PLEO|nr:hypothetical protein FB567DRAFT_561890 [Paraphoma chrysanthemicola]
MTARPLDTAAHRRKRVRFDTDNSSEPSISDESALASTNAADDSTVASDYDSNSDSELSESSEEPSSESSSEDEEDDAASDMDLEEQRGEDGVVNVRVGKKPTMKLDRDELGPDIGAFLKEFLPQLKAANDELEAQRKAGTLDSKMIDAGEEEDAEQYIEMDLGLGVLEEKDPNADDDSSSDSDDTLDGNEKEKDVLGKLMGRTNSRKPVVVQEVGTAPEP